MDKFYADRPDKDAEPVGWFPSADWGQYFNPFLKVRYIPRPWWKFWAPKYTVTFEGNN
ncbi:hypothetical protein [Dyadobacter bucti]|uniref:hypothetical protein n=1 Tax=Dyadobacter bucti TaxID=2572203 RepID=UPI0014091319|nr:hypothetical protein [Dyadobacter bucti]